MSMDDRMHISMDSAAIKGNNPYLLSRTTVDNSFRSSGGAQLDRIQGYSATGDTVFRGQPGLMLTPHGQVNQWDQYKKPLNDTVLPWVAAPSALRSTGPIAAPVYQTHQTHMQGQAPQTQSARYVTRTQSWAPSTPVASVSRQSAVTLPTKTLAQYNQECQEAIMRGSAESELSRFYTSMY